MITPFLCAQLSQPSNRCDMIRRARSRRRRASSSKALKAGAQPAAELEALAGGASRAGQLTLAAPCSGQHDARCFECCKVMEHAPSRTACAGSRCCSAPLQEDQHGRAATSGDTLHPVTQTPSGSISASAAKRGHNRQSSKMDSSRFPAMPVCCSPLAFTDN